MMTSNQQTLFAAVMKMYIREMESGVIRSTPEHIAECKDALKWLNALQEGAKQIPLTQGKVAIVDAADYDWLMQWNWRAYQSYGCWYAMRTARKEDTRISLQMHRVIMDAPRGKVVDHINGNGLDNRRANLRLCTDAENRRNAKLPANNTSGYRGVSWSKRHKKWLASIQVDGKQKYQGHYDDAIDAAIAYDKAAIVLHGEFARLNFPQSRENEHE